MAAVLQFRTEIRRVRRDTGSGRDQRRAHGETGKVIIFPGVRIERNGLDLSHRRVRVGTVRSVKAQSVKAQSDQAANSTEPPAEEA